MSDDLLSLLEINGDRIPTKNAVAVKYLQRRWEECGRPTELGAVRNFLDEALTSCANAEFLYPKVLLKRLKEMQRGEWEPNPLG